MITRKLIALKTARNLTNQQIADMRVAEQKRKQALAEKKNARMLRKTGAA